MYRLENLPNLFLVDTYVVGRDSALISRFLGSNLRLNCASVSYVVVFDAVVWEQVLLSLFVLERKLFRLHKADIDFCFGRLPWIGLSVCELTECSPRWVFWSLCRITFSIFSSEETSKCPPPPAALDRSRNDSSVCVDLSTCKIVHDADMLQDGRRYSASNDAVRRMQDSVVLGFPFF